MRHGITSDSGRVAQEDYEFARGQLTKLLAWRAAGWDRGVLAFRTDAKFRSADVTQAS
jgi:hypothetical protein